MTSEMGSVIATCKKIQATKSLIRTQSRLYTPHTTDRLIVTLMRAGQLKNLVSQKSSSDDFGSFLGDTAMKNDGRTMPEEFKQHWRGQGGKAIFVIAGLAAPLISGAKILTDTVQYIYSSH